MVLIIDNYDSFTFNLVQCLGELDPAITVVRNDRLDVGALLALRPDRIVVSPGPGRPEAAGESVALIRSAGTIPVLGVCLGHQAIGVAFGALVDRAARLVHGKVSRIIHDGRGVFAGVAQAFEAARYHSLVIVERTLTADLIVTARAADDGAVMGVQHVRRPVHGVQFHPESILTVAGRQIVRNFMSLQGGSA